MAIEDSGSGISPELLPRLFSPFVTGRKREGPRPGTGLGLAIARGIIEAHGGSITIESTEGAGSVAKVRIPRLALVGARATASMPTPGRGGEVGRGFEIA